MNQALMWEPAHGLLSGLTGIQIVEEARKAALAAVDMTMAASALRLLPVNKFRPFLKQC